MRDFVKVADAILGLIPEFDIVNDVNVAEFVAELEKLQESCYFTAPEALPGLWGRAEGLLNMKLSRYLKTDQYPWVKKSIDIWNDKTTHEVMQLKCTACGYVWFTAKIGVCPTCNSKYGVEQ